MACNTETFTWSITNFSLCPLKEGEYLASPTFFTERLQKTKWCLKLYPKGYAASENSLSCFLRRVDFLKEPEEVRLDFSLSIKKDSQLLELGSSKNVSFSCHQGMGFVKLITLEDLFTNKELFLTQDTLTIQCCLWHADILSSSFLRENIPDVYSMDSFTLTMEEHSSIVSDEFSTARNRSSKSCFVTTIPVDRHCVTWSIKGFQTSGEFKRTAIISSKIRDKSELVLTCYTSKDSNSQTWLRVDIQRKDLDMRQMMLKAKISVLNRTKSVHSSREDHRLFGDDHKVWRFPPLIELSREDLKNGLLDRNELSLQCDFHTSFKDEQLTMFQNRLQSVNSTLFSDYNSDMGRMLHNFGSRSCKEHRNILCSHSPLFQAMRLNHSNTGQSSDQDRDTLLKMVAYLFNNEFIGEYEYEDVKMLYTVATEYEIHALKQKCVSFLKSHLTVSNVWDVLTFANLHNDDDLMKFLLSFLFLNRETVFQSPEWEDLMNDNSQLAGEIMKKVLTLKVN